MNLNNALSHLSSLYDNPFRLSDDFIADYESRSPDWGVVGWVTFSRTYARKLPNGEPRLISRPFVVSLKEPSASSSGTTFTLAQTSGQRRR